MKNIKLKKIKAFLFDMDGILVDSMPYHFIAWFESLREYGVRIMPEIVFRMEGAKWHNVANYVFEKNNKKLTDKIEKDVFNKKEKYFKKHFKRYIFDESEKILSHLKKRGFKIGLVTGSNLSEAKNMLPQKIYDTFDIRVSGDMVKRGKPYPDSYLLAAEKLGVVSKECIVIENAPYGIRAAKSAKMFCVAIATSLPTKYLNKADLIFKNHEAFCAWLKNA